MICRVIGEDHEPEEERHTMQKDIFAATRKTLVPDIRDAFMSFTERVFAESTFTVRVKQLIEMRAGGAYTHSAIALDAIAGSKSSHGSMSRIRS
jgi:hypothetical protein